jgi:hypothetical protein
MGWRHPMKKIYKYEIPVDGEKHVFDIPWPAYIVHVNHQGRMVSVCIWAEVQDDQPPVQKWFQVFGTGHEVPDNASYIGTAVVTPNLVWHVFEIN